MGVIVSSCCSCCYFLLREVIPLLQCGVPSMGDSPLKNLQREPFPRTTVLPKLLQQWFSHGCSPSGTVCFSVGSPQGQKSCQQICSCLSCSMHGFLGACSSVASQGVTVVTGLFQRRQALLESDRWMLWYSLFDLFYFPTQEGEDDE